MTSFRSKKIVTTPTLGEVLVQHRKDQRHSLDYAARQTAVSADYLKALENGRYDQLPGDIYAKNFIKAYAKFLGLPAEKLLEDYENEKILFKKTKKINSFEEFERPIAKAGRIHFLAIPKIMRVAALCVLALVCAVYIGSKVMGIFAPPVLVVSQPASDVIIADPLVKVEGEIEKDATLKINGQHVFPNDDGIFSEQLTLQHGTNIIEVTAKKKHSQPVTVYRQVVVSIDDEGMAEFE